MENLNKKDDEEQLKFEFDEKEDKDLALEMTDLKEPFNPQDIDIQAVQTTMYTLIQRLEHKEIDLNPEFQRAAGLWQKKFMSRLVESLLIRFPLPAFYFDATDDNLWQVVDGLQRLSTIQKFIVDKTLELTELEFLPQYDGASYDDLPRNMQRRIDEAQVTMYLIKPGTPTNVKYSLFHRINTGGVQLKPQEIRHALSQGQNEGQASNFLKEITDTTLFKRVARISNRRMLDRELVLRYIALKLKNYTEYKAPMITFLNSAMETLGVADDTKLKQLKKGILNSFSLAQELFGENAFRKSLANEGNPKAINRALFEAISVIFSELSENERVILIKNKSKFISDFKILFENSDFYASITYSTAHKSNVTTRFQEINKLVQKHIK
jgi:hypothetical protein